MNRIKRILYIMIFATISLVVVPPQPTQAAIPLWIIELIRKGVAKVLRAIDLMIQRLQNKTIWLQNAQKVLENKLSQFKLTEIAQSENPTSNYYIPIFYTIPPPLFQSSIYETN